MPFKNFSVWRGKLPHWRADGVVYYVTFRHRRSLSEAERSLLLKLLVRPDGQRWDLMILCVLPDKTDLIFRVLDDKSGAPYELADIVEKAKAKAGKQIQKKTGERFSPFYAESYDRIVRDEVELEQRWQEVFDAPIAAELSEDPEDYTTLWVAEMQR